MSTIDTDAHVLESAHTWDYMDEGEREMRPQKILDLLPSEWVKTG